MFGCESVLLLHLCKVSAKYRTLICLVWLFGFLILAESRSWGFFIRSGSKARWKKYVKPVPIVAARRGISTSRRTYGGEA